MKFSVKIGALAMKNPVTVASGTFANGREYAELWQAAEETGLSALGALITKGVSAQPWAGNPGIRVAESASGMLNSIGLQNPGVEAFCAQELSWLAEQDLPVIVNVSGHSAREYAQVIERLEAEAQARAAAGDKPGIAAFEVNISCPNVDCGGISFGTDARLAAAVTAECRAALMNSGSTRPLIVKLTPNVTDITEIARACESAGADALSLVNTVAGMAVDLRRRAPVFKRVVAGLSGPAIKPIALYAVYRVHQAVRLPLIGVGGIASGSDAAEFLLAGASAVAVGSAIFSDPLAPLRIISELRQWCEENGVQDVHELSGAIK
jgi:dihydroorotate dehydrogenase (NAD+) catalytic subunit